MQRVALSGLDEAETAALVGDAALARTLQGRTAGNPFFIEEMLRSLAEAPEEPPGLPEGVKDLVSRRLSRLAPATVETLTAAAVLGRDFRLATLAAMAGRPGEELLEPLEEALRAGVVLEDAGARRPLRVRARARARDALRRARRLAPGAAAPARRARRSRPRARRPASSPTTSSPPARSAAPRRRSPTAPRRRARPWPRTPTRRPRGTSSRRSSRSGRTTRWRARRAPDRARRRPLAGERAGRPRRVRRGRRAGPPPRRARGAGARGARRRRPPLHADRARHRLRRPARGGARRARRDGRPAARAAAGAARGAPRARGRRRPPGSDSAPRRWRWRARPATRARSPPR